MRKTNYVVYDAPGCAPCVALKRILTEIGIKYEVRDALKNGLRSAPQLYAEDGKSQKLLFTGCPGKDDIKKILGVK